MSIDSDVVRLMEALVHDAKELRYGRIEVEVTIVYVVEVRDGKLQGWRQEGRRQMTVRRSWKTSRTSKSTPRPGRSTNLTRC